MEYRDEIRNKDKDNISINKLVKPESISKFDEQAETPNKLAKIKLRVLELKQQKLERTNSQNDVEALLKKQK